MNKYWFRKRRGLFTKDLGWGWIPISWEGWVLIIVSLLLIVGAFFAFDLITPGNTLGKLAGYLVSLIGIIVLASYVSHLKCRP